MTLDNVVKEVEPILQGSHFTHPSFQEVLTARHFAEEINSGRLDVKRAAHGLWFYDPAEDLAKIDMEYFDDPYPNHIKLEPRGLKSEWKPVLAHMAEMLNLDKAREFVDIVGDFHSTSLDMIVTKGTECALDDEPRQYFALVDDLVLSAKFIRQSKASASPDGNEKKILDALLQMGQASNIVGPQWNAHVAEQERLAGYALVLTKSEYVKNCLVEFIKQCAQRGRDIAREALRQDLASDPISSNPPAHEVTNKSERSGIHYDPFLSRRSGGELGVGAGRKSKEELSWLDYLTERILDLSHVFNSPEPSPRTDSLAIALELGGILGSIQGLDFPPPLIELFNDNVSRIKDESFVDIYRRTLDNFALSFKGQYRISLYERLEKGGKQFLNSEVYKPK